MDTFFIWAGIAMCLFALWAIARHDWLRLTRPTRRVLARVTGHRAKFEDGANSYTAIYSFSDERGAHEVIDVVYRSTKYPPEGTLRDLAYPEGRPDLARPPRPLLWAAIYAVLVVLPAMLYARWMDWIH